MIASKNVLVATDFSPASDAALLYGRELARLFGAQLHVIHVVGDIVASAMLPPTYVPEIGNAQKKIEEGARIRLHAVVGEDPERSPAAIEVVTTSLGPASAILSYAKDHVIDLIVVGAHGHNAVSRLLLGSVAEKIVRSAPCPVLTVRHPEREFVLADALQATVRSA